MGIEGFHRAGGVDFEQYHVPAGHALHHRVAANEAAVVRLDQEGEAVFERRALRRQVHAPAAIALLQPHRIRGIGAVEADAIGIAGFLQRQVEVRGMGPVDMQFIALFTHIGNAEHACRRTGNRHFARRQPGQPGNVCKLAENVARARPHEADDGKLVGAVADGDVEPGGAGVEQVEVHLFSRGGGVEIGAVGSKDGDGEFGGDTARRRQGMGEADAARLRRRVGAECVEEAQRVAPRHVEFREDREVSKRHALRHGLHLARHGFEPVGAAEAVTRFVMGLGREPVGPLGAMGGAHHCVALHHQFMQSGGAQVARGWTLLEGIMHAELQAEAFDGLVDPEAAVSPGAEAAAVHRERIHGWCAMRHPVREELAGTAAFHDAHRRAGEQPGIGHAVCRSDQRIGVGREGDGAIDDGLHACRSKRRHPRHGGLDDVFDAVEIGRHQFRAELGRHAVG